MSTQEATEAARAEIDGIMRQTCIMGLHKTRAELDTFYWMLVSLGETVFDLKTAVDSIDDALEELEVNE